MPLFKHNRPATRRLMSYSPFGFAVQRACPDQGGMRDATERSVPRLTRVGGRRDQQLKQENAELRELIVVAAHDLKEPLRNLRALAERVTQTLADQVPAEDRELLVELERGAHRAETLVESLLLYTRVLSAPIRGERLELTHSLDSALLNLGERIEEQGATVTREPMPVVDADGARMLQVFQNLLANALTYRGDRPAEVHVGASRSDATWTVYVRDRGIGVAPRHREKIFDPFERLHPQSRFAGSGLGLAICRKIVEGHGGRIWTQETPGGGATFLFSLPDPGS